MSIKSDKWIREMSLKEEMISPFVDNQIRKGTISYGLSSYGYDIRVSDEYKVFTNVNNSVVDPKKFDEKSFIDYKGDICIVPPNSFALARSIEYFKIPRNVLTVCLGKSTYARCGIIVNVTPFEPEWEGHVTLEISNTTHCLQKFIQMKVYVRYYFSNQMKYVKNHIRIKKVNIKIKEG